MRGRWSTGSSQFRFPSYAVEFREVSIRSAKKGEINTVGGDDVAYDFIFLPIVVWLWRNKRRFPVKERTASCKRRNPEGRYNRQIGHVDVSLAFIANQL